MIIFILYIFVIAKTGTTSPVKFNTQLLERLMANTQRGPMSPERLNSLSWFLQLHVQNPSVEVIPNTLPRPKPAHLRSVRHPSPHHKTRIQVYPQKEHEAKDYMYHSDEPILVNQVKSYDDQNTWNLVDMNEWAQAYDDENYADKYDNNIPIIDELPRGIEATYSAEADYTHYGSKQSLNIQDVDYQEYMSFPHEDVCKTQKTWQLLNQTINQRGEHVRILPNTTHGGPQYVYIYKCVYDECTRCKGVQRNSRCVMRESFLKLYHEVLDYDNYGLIKYDYVRVPTHCTCELLPDNFTPERCSKTNKDSLRWN